MVIRQNTSSPHNCHSTTTTSCTLTFSGLSVSGVITSTTLPTLATGNAITMTGGPSSSGTLLVSGNFATCGSLLGANNGYVSIDVKLLV